jgi:hypothetical protein
MQLAVPRTRIVLAAAVAAALCLYSQNTPSTEVHGVGPQGMPPRTAPTDYQAHAQAGSVTIAADFSGHFIPRPDESSLTTDDFVVVEVALYGQPGARLILSPGDFSLRINGKKTPLPGQPYGLVTSTLKDPNWEPPATPKPRTIVGSEEEPPGPKGSPTPIHIPIEVQRAWAHHVQKSTLAEGDRPLPQAGLIYFLYRGKITGIHSIELIYGGPAGKATLALQP